jgi:DNA-binding NarL/FixJ family response regulator
MHELPVAERFASLEAVVCQPGYFERAIEMACRVATANTQVEVDALLREAVPRLGADVAVFATFLPQPARLNVLLACDPTWIAVYEDEALFAHDPWALYASECDDPVCGSRLAVTSERQRRAIELAAQYGFVSTLLVPVRRCNGRRSWLVLGSRQPGWFEGDGHTAARVAANSLASELQAWFALNARTDLIERVGLSEEDIAMVRLRQAGLSWKQIAGKLDLTHDAVRKRFERLKNRLGVGDPRAAVALLSGLSRPIEVRNMPASSIALGQPGRSGKAERSNLSLLRLKSAGLNYDEIGARMGLSAEAVRTRWKRLKQRMGEAEAAAALASLRGTAAARQESELTGGVVLPAGASQAVRRAGAAPVRRG